ncbi:class I SAM-dependent methyltransferase [Fructobacillus evanidus]|uniref:16S rRNA G1207 methylase RsmC (RsmC) n=1 Tax=Fructobacillus evanidus TaxID=3064281 RepID=A0ABM9MRM2_9LACO|nr:16S rRNA G1207 methylase RsmC (RsmC) [Fructobacillus sp. LMG 32999]CAK1235077.1 16S rRNA G1207 methylase RsmC (RsmC) [Fructobacillus sp. LMG 32999]CAK1235528.1 16S rRNA G1207 methylase RsmC (RsmC) [Fructobacillus sp. LMG 32999]CAK1235530.1 16S rRNA G1207 methylase RsmC (RsmC) [Fructobacillus sp. LMG 32999]CAK1238220.1 16S rRNA G1207 methylase RsmC (RsmC) [Fructobacillus sp. LMG 32999]
MTEKISGEQYFTAQPDAAHDYQDFDFELLGNNLHFTTDAGVFSKRTVDFGTRTMLSVAAETDFPAGRVLDLGTGYGPVGIAIAKALNKNVDMVDVNQRALDLAQKNANKNGVGSQVKIFQSNIYEGIQDQYALILVNPPIRAGKPVVTAMLQEAKNHLLPGGKLLAVLQKKQGAPSAQKNLKAVFDDVSIVGKNKGYYVLEAVNG